MNPDPSAVAQPIQIMLVDDHPAVRDGLALLLALEGITVCASASSSAEALTYTDASGPDLALVDLSLGNEDGLVLVADLRARAVPVLVYSMHEDAIHVEGAFAAGALGYVTKRELHRVLVDAIREVAAGRRFICPNAALALTERLADMQKHANKHELSDQEWQVYHLLGQGEGTLAIADVMGISPRTVESYYARIQDKFGLAGMRELRRHAIAHRA
ncbi:MAG: response regulator [Armatimonadota bacterium]